MANEHNLTPFNTLSPERLREITSMGGKASAKKRAKNRRQKRVLQIMISMPPELFEHLYGTTTFGRGSKCPSKWITKPSKKKLSDEKVSKLWKNWVKENEKLILDKATTKRLRAIKDRDITIQDILF